MRGRKLGVAAFAAALICGSAIAVVAPSAEALPLVLHVSTTGTDTGDCLVTDCATLGYALTQAAAGDTIVIRTGTYLESTATDVAEHTANVVPPTLSGITIESASGSPTNTIIDATGQQFGIAVLANDVSITGLTIEHAGASGIVFGPSAIENPSYAGPPVSVSGESVIDNVVDNNDQCNADPTAAYCPAPSPESDYGEGIHLISVAYSDISANQVENNFGGILVTDEVGPNHNNTLSDNIVSDNVGDCGITLAGHSSNAVSTSGPTTGQPQPAQAGVYSNQITGNTADNNGAAGLLAAASGFGAGVYNNTFEDNTADGNGLAGMTIHLHTPLADVSGNVVEGNTFSNDALHGGANGGPGDVEGPPSSADDTQSTGVEILGALSPLTGVVVEHNTISDVFYGVWESSYAASTTVTANTISVTTGGTPVFTEPGPYSGYWLAGGDGGLFTHGTATYHGSAASAGLGAPVVGIAPTPDSGGYWEVAANGAVAAFGDADTFGSMAGKHLNAPIVGIAATSDGGGYWLVASDGGVFNFGDAAYDGSMGGQHLNAPIVGVAATPDGGGYWLVASDGGVFTFGDATYAGSEGAKHLNAPIVGIAASPGAVNPSSGGISADGYWLVASDGGVFTFGNAGFFGSMGGQHLNAPIVGIAASPGVLNFGTLSLDSDGYWLVASDGGVFTFGQAGFFGSQGSTHLNASVIGIAGT